MTFAPGNRAAAPGVRTTEIRAATARRSPSGIVRVVRPTSKGWPVPFSTIGTTAASQHSIRSDSGATGPPKSRHAARARFSRSSSRITTFTCGRSPAALGDVAVVEDVAADVGQCFGLPLAGRPVVVGGERLGVGVDHRGDRVEHRGVVEPALDLPAAAGQPGQEQLVHLGRGPVVGLGPVLVQQLDQRLAPVVQLRRGVQLGLRGELLLRTRPLLGDSRAAALVRAPGRSPRHAAGPPGPPRTPRRSPAAVPGAPPRRARSAA